MQNYTNTKHPNSRKLQKEKHTQVAVTGGTALGGVNLRGALQFWGASMGGHGGLGERTQDRVLAKHLTIR